jgi:NADH:ubiquinone oxidoreductase subunit 6 (subunit J)
VTGPFFSAAQHLERLIEPLAFAGMALSLLGVSAAIRFQASAIVVLVFVLTYVACFAIGVGTGTWVVMAEICPTRVRGRAMSLATVCLWCGTLLVTLTFLSLVNVLQRPALLCSTQSSPSQRSSLSGAAFRRQRGVHWKEIEKCWLTQRG